jgi:ABC-type glycerol-3-phosphate transport system substrate-binding protein
VVSGIALKPPDSAAETFRAILLSYGGDLIDPDTHEPLLDSFAARSALETTIRLAGLDEPAQALERSLSTLPGMAANGSFNVLPVIWASDSSVLWAGGEWDLNSLPEGRIGRATGSATFWMWGVPAGAPSVDKARQFVQWVTSRDVQARLWRSTGLLPATRSAMNGVWDPGGDAMKHLTLRSLDRCRFRPQLRSFRSLMEIAGQMIEDAISGDGGPQQYRLRANEEMRTVLSQEGELDA